MHSESRNELKPYSSPEFNNISVAMKELVEMPEYPDFTKPKFTTISFYAEANCTVIANEKYEFKVKAPLGLELDERFETIYSFKIKEDGVSYFFLASF